MLSEHGSRQRWRNAKYCVNPRRYEQRLDVAAARDCDQLWLFRSVHELELHPNCMLRRVVQFMTMNPNIMSSVVDQKQFRRLAHVGNRAVEPHPNPFENWFEVDVLLSLVSQCYQPQTRSSQSQEGVPT